MVEVIIQRLDPKTDLPLPYYATDGAAGMDLLATGNYEILPQRTVAVPCGIAIALPAGYEAQVRSRSGMALKYQVVVMNAPGTVDSDYRGEIFAMLTNFGTSTYFVKRGDRVAQMVIAPVSKATLIETTTNLSSTARNTGGFGSTGR